MFVERAPAKVNLTLHIIGRRKDGFHELESLVAFTCFGDTLALEPGPPESLLISGPRAGATGPLHNNLVLKAARNLRAELPELKSGCFSLAKQLPAAAGIGGGSSDAAAALRLLARANGLDLSDAGLLTAAAVTGSDVPVCLGARARMMRGRGERLGDVLHLPPLHAVLVNPGVAVETKAVFANIGLKPGQSLGHGKHPEITDHPDFEDLVSALKKSRNDMEDAASVLAPVIGDVLAVLSAARGCKLARMSGSGATCFALFPDRLSASRAARSIRRGHPSWWVKACVLR
jgi:4-diphosphocytidyl-2-C-methyl-D-erythritol kinase